MLVMYNDSGSFKLAYIGWKRAVKGDAGKVLQIMFIFLTTFMVIAVGIMIWIFGFGGLNPRN